MIGELRLAILLLCAIPYQQIHSSDAEPADARLVVSQTNLSAADFSDLGAGQANVSETRLSAHLMKWKTRDIEVRWGLDYEYTQYEFARIDSRDRDLHRMQFPLSFELPARGWQLVGILSPGWATSSNVLKDLASRGTSEDLIVTGLAELRFPLAQPGWNAILGAGHDRIFGKSQGYPVAGISYQTVTGDFSARLAFPKSRLIRSLGNRQRLRLTLTPSGRAWHVESDETGSSFDYRVEGLRLTAAFDIRAYRALWLTAMVGYEVSRHHQFLDDLNQRIDTDLDSQWLVGFGVRIVR